MHPKALLEACTELVRLTLKFDHPADAAVARFFRENRTFGPRERTALADTVYAVLRKKLLFDHMAPSGSGPKERRLAILGFAHSTNTQGREFLKGALTDQEAQWLARCDSIQVSDLMERHRHSLPDWLVTPLKAQLGDGFWPLVAALDEPAGLDVRVNVLTEKRADVQKELAKAAIKSEATKYSPWGLRLEGKPSLAKVDAFTRGAIEVQDEGSQLLALVLDAKRGEMVADFCAGAGGKTLAIGAMMKNTGRLYAMDVAGHRLAKLKPRLARSGLSNVQSITIETETDARVKRLYNKLDRVFIDAPCSGLGTLRRNPDLKWRHGVDSVARLAVLQASILNSAAQLVKVGGTVVYATCSILPDENQNVVNAFLAANPNYEIASVVDALAVQNVTLPDNAIRDGFLQLLPHLHETDGFFAACLKRVA